MSRGVKLFEKGLQERWQLQRYHDIRQPALFVGMYNESDIEVLRKHKGFKVVWLTGADRRNVEQVLAVPDVVFCLSDIGLQWLKRKVTKMPPYRIARIPIKDYSAFKPVKLGENVYCYVGKGNNKGKFEEKLLREIAAKSRHPFIYGIQGQPITEVQTKYYAQSFINIKLNPFAGTTTAYEMAFMGRRSVSNMNEEWYLNWQTADDVVRLIEQESKLIGVTPNALVPDGHFVGEEWKQTEFWT